MVEARRAATAQSYTGKTLWILDGFAAADFCKRPAEDCGRRFRGPFQVTGLVAGPDRWDYFVLKAIGSTDTYFTKWNNSIYFVEYDPEERSRKAAEECRRKGDPKIGMNWQDVYDTCWGRPTKINTTETSAGTFDQFVYPGGKYLYLLDGYVTAIQSFR